MDAAFQIHRLEYQRLRIDRNACLEMRTAHQHRSMVDGGATADRCAGYCQHAILETVQLHLSVNYAVIADIDRMPVRHL